MSSGVTLTDTVRVEFLSELSDQVNTRAKPTTSTTKGAPNGSPFSGGGTDSRFQPSPRSNEYCGEFEVSDKPALASCHRADHGDLNKILIKYIVMLKIHDFIEFFAVEGIYRAWYIDLYKIRYYRELT